MVKSGVDFDFHLVDNEMIQYLEEFSTTCCKPNLNNFKNLQTYQKYVGGYDEWGYPVWRVTLVLARGRMYTDHFEDFYHSMKDDPYNKWAFWQLSKNDKFDDMVVIKLPGRIGREIANYNHGDVRKACVNYNNNYNKRVVNCLIEVMSQNLLFFEEKIVTEIIVPYLFN